MVRRTRASGVLLAPLIPSSVTCFRYGRENHRQATGLRGVRLRGCRKRRRRRQTAAGIKADILRPNRLGRYLQENVGRRSGTRIGQQRRSGRHRTVPRRHQIRLGQVNTVSIVTLMIV